MARRLLCRDRRERPLVPAKVERDVVRWVELRCALDLDDADRALVWLLQLVESGGATDPCRWLARVERGLDTLHAAVNKAIARRGLPACAR